LPSRPRTNDNDIVMCIHNLPLLSFQTIAKILQMINEKFTETQM